MGSGSRDPGGDRATPTHHPARFRSPELRVHGWARCAPGRAAPGLPDRRGEASGSPGVVAGQMRETLPVPAASPGRQKPEARVLRARFRQHGDR